MKKLILAIAALAFSCAAFAQDREIDLEEWDNFNKIELSKGRTRVESNLTFAFPMYFGWTTLTNINYKGYWAPAGASSDYYGSIPSAYGEFLNFDTGKNFVYGLQLLGMDIRYGAFGVNLGIRWTFMDFTFKNSDISMGQMTATNPGTGAQYSYYTPYMISKFIPNYDFKKSKIHASYFGIPVRLSLNFGKATVYAGGSVEFLTNGYAKYRSPKSKAQMKDLFNSFRATVEGGFSYGNLGMFVQYGLTPLFPASLSDARTLTFGILLGL